MRTRTTLILLAIVLAIGLFIKLYESKRPNTEESKRRAQNVLNFERDRIDGIAIQNGDERIELKRVDKKWRMESPVKDSADGTTIDSLLFDLEGWQKEATISSKEIETDKSRMAEYGVAKAKLRLKLLGANAPPEILFGNNAALEGRTYVRLENSKDVFLSAGCDFFWRKHAAEIVALWNPPCVLDAATGSGDLALVLQRKLPRSKITAVDFSSEMLELARRKGVRETVVADALQLPFASQAFDAVTIAFGLRNMRDWAAALREMSRVLTPSGYLLMLDFSLPHYPALRAAYRIYLHKILPRLCTLLTSDRRAYEYLGASIENFPSGRAMCDLINANGFVHATGAPLTGGIVTVYTASCNGGL